MDYFGLAVHALTLLINRKLKKVVQIYREQKRLLIKEFREINRKKQNPSIDIEEKDDLYYLRRLYITDYRQHLIITAFLMFYSYLEEALPQVHGAYEKGNVSSSTRKTGIEKYKEIFEKDFQVNIANFPQWGDLKDFSKIRHIILHTNGNIHLAKNENEIGHILYSKKNFIFVRYGRIRLRESILNEFENTLDCFVRWVLNQLKDNKKMHSIE